MARLAAVLRSHVRLRHGHLRRAPAQHAAVLAGRCARVAAPRRVGQLRRAAEPEQLRRGRGRGGGAGEHGHAPHHGRRGGHGDGDGGRGETGGQLSAQEVELVLEKVTSEGS